VTYHNLVVTDYGEGAPKRVANKPNCQNVTNCSLNVRKITFDVATWSSSSDWKKSRVSWVITPDIPAFAGGITTGFGGIVSQCTTEYETAKDNSGNDRQYLVSSCPQVLRDFQ